MSRCLVKPTKRFFFAYADNISNKWIKISFHKYTLKYINKLNKVHKLNNNSTEELFDIETMDSSQYYRVTGLIEFRYNLQNNLDKEKGLAHSKVREYWLRRGPRLLFVLILTILITIVLAVLLLDRSFNENMYSILVGLNLILFSIYMLYARLIDSISGAMMRIGHDNYTRWKSTQLSIESNSVSIQIYKCSYKCSYI